MADLAHYNQRDSAAHARRIGILQRATPLTTPWTGEQRVRFSDFQVNEIRPDGSVVHLQTLGYSDEERQPRSDTGPKSESSKEAAKEVKNGEEKPKPEVKEEPKEEVKEEDTQISPEDITILANLAGQKFADDLVKLFQAGPTPDPPLPRSVTLDPVEDKFQRGQIHQEVRRIFHSRINTNTDPDGGIIATLVTKRGKKRGRRDRDRNDDKPAGAEYLHFTLYKDNRDTMDAVNQISRLVKVRPQLIGYAGTKDRRASTVQRCSIRYARTKSLAAANGKLWGVATGDYEYCREGIHLGLLLGNEFTIIIKQCDLVGGKEGMEASEKLQSMSTSAQTALNHMYEHGWINYFGHQRFGTHQIGTHHIGQLLLGDKFEEAVTALLAYEDDIAQRAEAGDTPDEAARRDEFARHHACMLFQTDKDVERAMRIMPRRFAAETALMRHLTRQGRQSKRDFVGAVISINRALRTMYLHAYQSLVWNHAASKRWELHGDTVVEGDLVLLEREEKPAVPEQDQDGQDVVHPTDTNPSTRNAEDDDSDPEQIEAHALTADEAASGKYNIFDVVLPSPGHSVTYPSNALGAYYSTFMALPENGGLDPHSMRRMRREFSLPGRYRKLMGRFLARPSVEFRMYADETEQMSPTDMDRVKAGLAKSREQRGKRSRGEDGEPSEKRAKVEENGEGDEKQGETIAEDPTPAEGDQQGEAEEKTETETVVEANKIAAIVKFQLGRSAYATVTLRDLMGDPAE